MDTENLSLAELQRGYSSSGGDYTCLVCGQQYAAGEVHPIGGRYYEAARAAEVHRATAHPDYLARLIASASKYNTLTENQREMLSRFAAGQSDKEIAAALGLSLSTVRHGRFTFRERAKQAKHYLAVYEGVFGGQADGPGAQAQEAGLVAIPSNARGTDERYVVTAAEREAVLKTAFSGLSPLRLAHFPRKEKKKLVVLGEIARLFEAGREYTEKEVNAVLEGVWEDYATLRRYLIEYEFLSRTRDGARYWVTDGGPF